MIWMTSDFHFNHNKKFIYEARGFDSIEQMNKKIIENYNSKVRKDDIVYILGDCALGDIDSASELLKQLNGHKYLAYGNHDTENKIGFYKENKIFEDIQFGYRLTYHKKTFLLTHFPTLVYEFGKTYNLFGHTHSSIKIDDNVNMYNISLEANNYYPNCLDSILYELISARNIKQKIINKKTE